MERFFTNQIFTNPRISLGISLRFFLAVPLLLFSVLLAGCGSITGNLAASLSQAISQNNDLETVKEGGPAYLIMVDAFVMDDPLNPELLASAANLYSTYSDVFVTDKERSLRLTGKAFGYALRAACNQNKDMCDLDKMDFPTFETRIKAVSLSDTPVLYTLGASWAGWIRARSGSMKAISQIPRIERIMERVVELNEGYQDGGAHLYLGALAMILPPVFGGRPEAGKAHFEKGVSLAGTKNLMARVLYAKNYARPMFDRELHDRLLNEVLLSPVGAGEGALINTLARDEAQKLLKSGDDYF